MIARCVKENKTLIATYTPEVMKLADVVVVDVQCDYLKKDLGNLRTGSADMAALEKSLATIGEMIPPECLVLIETTVAPGTTEYVAYPILKKAFEKRGLTSEPLLAHSFERVMPGRNYVSSIRDFWRVCSGVNEESRKRVVKFLSEVLNVEKFPLTGHGPPARERDPPRSSRTASGPPCWPSCTSGVFLPSVTAWI